MVIINYIMYNMCSYLLVEMHNAFLLLMIYYILL
jgi:hypothetical protein